jgi:hypothetical protein
LGDARAAFLAAVQEVNYQFDIFNTYFQLYLRAELEYVEDFYELKPINEEMGELLIELKRSFEILQSNFYGRVHPANMGRLRDRFTEGAKRVYTVVDELGKCWARRVVMDVRYTVAVKSTRVVNDHLLSGMQNLTGALSHILTA